jgi:hypothetical protein
MTLREQHDHISGEIKKLRNEIRAGFYFKNKRRIPELYGKLSVLEGQYFDVTELLKKIGDPNSEAPIGPTVSA